MFNKRAWFQWWSLKDVFFDLPATLPLVSFKGADADFLSLVLKLVVFPRLQLFTQCLLPLGELGELLRG